MDAKDFQGNIFKIVATHSGKALEIPGDQTLNDNAPLQQWEYGGVENQKFLIFPIGDVGKYYAIASLASGKFLDVCEKSLDESAKIQQLHWNGGDNQLFELEAVANEPNTFFIRAKHSGKLLNVSGISKENGAKVLQYQSFGHNNEKFKLEKVDEIKISGKNKVQDILTKTSAIDPSEFPSLASPQKPQNTRDWKVVGKPFLLPYFMVKDNNPHWQIKKSPYYLFTREVCYTLNDEYFCYNNTGADQEYEVTVRAGFTTEEAKNLSQTIGMEVSGTVETKAGSEANAVVAKVSVETSLSITASASTTLGYSTSTSLSRHNETEVRRLVNCPAYTSLAVWTQTSRFTLSRLDSSLLRRWEVLEGGIFIDDHKIPQ